MIEDAQQPLVETPTEVALADDYARLCAAFREAVGHEDALARIHRPALGDHVEGVILLPVG